MTVPCRLRWTCLGSHVGFALVIVGSPLGGEESINGNDSLCIGLSTMVGAGNHDVL